MLTMTDVGSVRLEKMHVESFAQAITGVLDVSTATHSALNANIRRKLVFVKVAFSALGVAVIQKVGSTSRGLRAQEAWTLHCQVWGVCRPHASESIQQVGARWAALARPGPWPGAVLLCCVGLHSGGDPARKGPQALVASSGHLRILCPSPCMGRVSALS